MPQYVAVSAQVVDPARALEGAPPEVVVVAVAAVH
jgi:hypothetical protein